MREDDDKGGRVPVAFEVMRETSFGEPGFERELIRIFLVDNDERIARIGAAIHARDAQRLRSEAHALKGASGTVGAEQLALLARRLEHMGAKEELAGSAAGYKSLVEEYARVREALEGHVRSLPLV